MGALLGRISPIQLLVMGLFEIVLFASNEFLQIELMKVKSFFPFVHLSSRPTNFSHYS